MTKKTLAAALCAAQAEFPAIPKSKTAKLPNGREFTYADIHDVLKIVLPILAKHGIALTQTTVVKDGSVYLESTLHHADSDQIISSMVPMIIQGAPARGGGRKEIDMAAVGTSLTYARRYGVSSLLGLQTEEDMDGQHHETFQPVETKTTQQKQPDDNECPF